MGVLVGRWDISDYIDDGKIVYVGQPAWNAHLYNEINGVVNVLSSKGAQVVLLTMPDIDAADEAPGSAAYAENDPSRVTEWNQILVQCGTAPRQGCHPHRSQQETRSHGVFQVVIDGVTVRWTDGIHISEPGGEWLQPFIFPTVARLGLTARARAKGNQGTGSIALAPRPTARTADVRTTVATINGIGPRSDRNRSFSPISTSKMAANM